MNSPYTRHLDPHDSRPGTSHPHPHAHTPYPVYAYAPPPPVAPYYAAPPTVQRTPGWVVGLLVGVVAFGALYVMLAASGNGLPGARPSWQEMQRYEELSRREGESDGKKKGKEEGIKQGKEEMAYRVQYERLVNQASAFNAGWSSGMGTGRRIGAANYNARYGSWGAPWGRPYRGYGSNFRGYGSGYRQSSRSRTASAVGQAQQIANATGQPVDVIVD